jgi:hypothetical protein
MHHRRGEIDWPPQKEILLLYIFYVYCENIYGLKGPNLQYS